VVRAGESIIAATTSRCRSCPALRETSSVVASVRRDVRLGRSQRRGAIIPTPRHQGVDGPAATTGTAHWSWASLLGRGGALELATGPFCRRGALRSMAAITQEAVMTRLLRPLQLAAVPPPMAPARVRQATCDWVASAHDVARGLGGDVCAVEGGLRPEEPLKARGQSSPPCHNRPSRGLRPSTPAALPFPILPAPVQTALHRARGGAAGRSGGAAAARGGIRIKLRG